MSTFLKNVCWGIGVLIPVLLLAVLNWFVSDLLLQMIGGGLSGSLSILFFAATCLFALFITVIDIVMFAALGYFVNAGALADMMVRLRLR